MLNQNCTGIITCIQDFIFYNYHVKIKASGDNGINWKNILKYLNKIKSTNKSNIKGIKNESHHNRNEAITAII